MQIIGICGKAGSGKDTVAQYLTENYGYQQLSFAKILKDMLAVAGLGEPANRDDKEKNIEGFPFSFREAAQTLGTQWGRHLDKDIWVKLTMRSLKPYGKYVISDVRFENEATMVRENGFLIHVVGRSVDMGRLGTHSSEAGIIRKREDELINNSGHISLLHDQIQNLMD